MYMPEARCKSSVDEDTLKAAVRKLKGETNTTVMFLIKQDINARTDLKIIL